MKISEQFKKGASLHHLSAWRKEREKKSSTYTQCERDNMTYVIFKPYVPDKFRARDALSGVSHRHYASYIYVLTEFLSASDFEEREEILATST